MYRLIVSKQDAQVVSETRKIETNKNSKRLVTMQYDAGFLLYQLQYLANYEKQTTFENASFCATKLTTPHLVMRCNSTMGNPKMLQNSDRV